MTGTQFYNLLTSDITEAISPNVLRKPQIQSVIKYFADRIPAAFENAQLEHALPLIASVAVTEAHIAAGAISQPTLRKGSVSVTEEPNAPVR